MTEPDTNWKAVEPGVMVLPLTKFEIRHKINSLVPFRVYWNGTEVTAARDLQTAKERAAAYKAEMIEMGYEV